MKYNFPKIPFLLSFILCSVSIFIFFSLYNKINNDNIESNKIFVTWQKENKKKGDITLLNNFLKNTTEERAQLDSHFAQSSNAVSFLDMINELGTKVNAKAEVLVIDVPDDKTALYVGVKVSGTFDAVYKFIKLLENSPYEIEIVSMDMSKIVLSGSSNKQSFVWSVDLKIKLLSFIK